MKQYPNTNKFKFKKFHRVNYSYFSLLERKVFFPFFGQYAIQADVCGKLTYKQIEACRKVLRRGLGSKTFLWIRCFTYASVTKKPVASRMGKGKGGISHWMAPIRRGQVLFEIDCSSFNEALIILNKACSKLPIRTKILKIKY